MEWSGAEWNGMEWIGAKRNGVKVTSAELDYKCVSHPILHPKNRHEFVFMIS